MREQKKGRADHLNATPTDTSDCSDNSAEAQRARLLAALRRGPMTTLEIRRELDVLMPAARIHELRHLYRKNILTVRVHRQTESGQVHSVALYALQPDPPDLFVDDDPDYSPYLPVATIHSDAHSAALLT
jgi:hypothetical protein